MSEEDDWEYRGAADQDLPLRDRMRSERREVGLLGLIGHRISRAFISSYLKIWHRITIEGSQQLPTKTPFVLVANHSSHIDALALSTALPAHLTSRVFALAAGDFFFDTPRKSFFAAQAINALPVWRKRATAHAIANLRERLVSGDAGFILFPEGTRSRDGTLGAFKPGVGMLVAGTEIDVVPCHISGAHAAWPPGRKLPKPGRVSIRVGTPIRFAETANDRSGWIEVSQQLLTAVEALSKT
ncbi:MAG: 1-acyl-sn-glycerol-3-phosphate acyltransferase [Verrucomicrobiales bacterium]|jgi:1-acyl-sn-glycerol-3-phosphate acyltransferase